MNNNISLNKYKRHVPESKRKLNDIDISNIIKYLNKYSKETNCFNDKIRYLEYTKKFIYNKYIEDMNNRKISYNTFIKYIPKYYKYTKRKSDICGICEMGKNFSNINCNR